MGSEMTGQQRFEVALPAGPEAPRLARSVVDRVAAGLPGDVGFRARLAASELVTNSVRHVAHPRIRIKAAQTSSGLRVEVRDGGAAFDARPRRSLPDATSSRGLAIVDAIVDRWDTTPSDDNLVWFELDRPVGGGLPPAEGSRGAAGAKRLAATRV
jgi:anti-sigma regulatory factor (Ser/Thr protein kinase)